MLPAFFEFGDGWRRFFSLFIWEMNPKNQPSGEPKVTEHWLKEARWTEGVFQKETETKQNPLFVWVSSRSDPQISVIRA